MRAFRGLALGCLVGLALWGCGLALVRAATTSIGFNWVANYAAPPGETPQSALARIGGSAYRDYTDPFQGDTDRARIRLVRYGQAFQTPNALPGATYQLSNEPNLIEQDGVVRTPEGGRTFAAWFKAMRDQIKASDPTALIIGPSVWNWDGAGSTCCVTGRDAYQWFVEGHQALYGTPPQMDAMAVQIYPWAWGYWDDPHTAVPQGLAQIDGAQTWSAGRWPVAITEWGMLRKPFVCTVHTPQTEAERSTYTSGMLDGMRSRGVPLALYYASHEQLCDGNGYLSWLINRDGSLTVEGLAHHGTWAPMPTAGPRTTQPGHRVRPGPVP